MFSGKTTELLRRLENSAPEEVAAFKHASDNRYQTDAIVSHGGKSYPALGIDNAASIINYVGNGIRIVVIDEGHFFGPRLGRKPSVFARRKTVECGARIGDSGGLSTNKDSVLPASNRASTEDSFIATCRRLTGLGVVVVVALLDRDSWGRPFPLAGRLSAMADEVITKDAVCARCGGRACRTQRLTPIVDGNMVGGAESYEPRCRECWTPPPE